MQVTLEINTNSKKAIALLNYLRELEFVSIKDEELMSDELKNALDKGMSQAYDGQVVSHDNVVAETKQRYPDLFE
jgi:hypothetical protein